LVLGMATTIISGTTKVALTPVPRICSSPVTEWKCASPSSRYRTGSCAWCTSCRYTTAACRRVGRCFERGREDRVDLSVVMGPVGAGRVIRMARGKREPAGGGTWGPGGVRHVTAPGRLSTGGRAPAAGALRRTMSAPPLPRPPAMAPRLSPLPGNQDTPPPSPRPRPPTPRRGRRARHQTTATPRLLPDAAWLEEAGQGNRSRSAACA
jgi:hypothetical protein